MRSNTLTRVSNNPGAVQSVTQDALHDYGSNGLALICTNSSKASVFSLLRQSCTGTVPRSMTWPADETFYGPEQFEGICSETLERVVDKRTGRTRLQWKKIGRANEALDLLVYSLACVSHLGIPFLLAERELIEATTNARYSNRDYAFDADDHNIWWSLEN